MDHIWAPDDPAHWDDLLELFDLVLGEVISEAEALRCVTQQNWNLDNDEIRDGTAAAIEYALGDYLRPGYQLASLVLAAVERARPTGHELWRGAAAAYLAAATEMCVERQDALLFRRACDVAARLITESPEPTERGLALITAGSLRLEAYAENPIFDTYATAVITRHIRGNDLFEETQDSSDILRDAAGLFSRAAGLLRGAHRGFALAQKAYAQFSLAQSCGTSAQEEIIATCQEAWPLLAAEPLGQARVSWALARVRAFDQVPSRPLLLPPVSDIIRRYGIRRAVATIAVPIRLNFPGVADHSVDLASQLLDNIPPDRLERERRWLEFVRVHYLPDDPLDCWSAAAATSLSELQRISIRSAWSAGQFDAAALHVMAHSIPARDAELADLEYITDPEPASRYAGGLVDHIAARWAYLAATSREEASDMPAAARMYLLSAVHNSLLHYSEPAVDCLASVLRCLVNGQPDVAFAVVAELAHASDLLTGLLADQGGADALNGIFAQCFTRISELADGQAEPPDSTFETIIVLMQLAKGRVFAAAQAEAGPLDDDEFVSHVIDSERLVSARLGDKSGTWSDPRHHWDPYPHDIQLFDDEAALGAYLDVPEIEDGATLSEAQANIRRRYQRLDGIRTAITAAAGSRLLNEADLLSLTPPDAVLVALYYSGVGEPPLQGFHCVVCATDQPNCYLLVYDPSRPSVPRSRIVTNPAESGAARTSITYMSAGIHTAYVRRLLANDSPFRLLSREAHEALSDSAVHFGPLLDLLGPLHAAGKRHLVVWPHGPQYLLPFHLLPTGSGRIVADDWIVTITPSLQSLIGASRSGARSAMLAVASPDGGTRYGLPAEPTVTAQAETIAAAFGVAPLVPATREAFRTEIQGARNVHVAAHGAQYLPAPAFHCVYLDDGPVYAHEILKLDLRSVDLVTLSACQSSLLRYDVNDNLHGLPAAFLRAGAACVVGTLWPVEPAAAHDFFAALYRRIAAGDGKLAAFRAAQMAVRDRYPQYRHWGAFCMLGDWREDGQTR